MSDCSWKLAQDMCDRPSSCVGGQVVLTVVH